MDLALCRNARGKYETKRGTSRAFGPNLARRATCTILFAAADSVVARVLTSRIGRAYKTPTERGAVLALVETASVPLKLLTFEEWINSR